MEFLLIIPAIVLGVVFFLNIKNTATILTRIIGGFISLIIYNTLALHISFPLLGVNLISAIICGILGFPGGVLLLCLSLF